MQLNRNGLIGISSLLGLGVIVTLSAAVYFYSQYSDLAIEKEALLQKHQILENNLNSERKDKHILNNKLDHLKKTINAKTISARNSKKRINSTTMQRTKRKTTHHNFMEKLKAQNPERYDRMQQARKHIDEKRGEAFNNQIDFIDTLDVSLMNEKQFQNHNRLQELLKKKQKIQSEINDNPENENVKDLRRQLYADRSEMRNLYNTEKDTALMQIGRNFGCSDKEAKELKNRINNIHKQVSPPTSQFISIIR